MSAPNYPTPTRAERKAWRRKKENDRRVAAYRNSLPSAIGQLTELLETAPSDWHADVIRKRIDHRREMDHRRRAQRRQRFAARSPEEVRDAQLAKWPSGAKACKRCGEVHPVDSFPIRPASLDGVGIYCNPCDAQRLAESPNTPTNEGI
ncbi:hypothetical protein [Curtobacterium sp. MCJR17_020]|uniref:hypothetical protein n=1 Tax=Curtobacterium sp. MCJR17_020 TaxID=2175619 RepID=UPI0011B5E20C|nr:hypothetical protein [Curtobacterium sp. MCJR17_020]WIE70803.1 hypothetical protein DEJ14_011350 [Curtobacterium sp. MCJR17_020]